MTYRVIFERAGGARMEWRVDAADPGQADALATGRLVAQLRQVAGDPDEAGEWVLASIEEERTT